MLCSPDPMSVFYSKTGALEVRLMIMLNMSGTLLDHGVLLSYIYIYWHGVRTFSIEIRAIRFVLFTLQNLKETSLKVNK